MINDKTNKEKAQLTALKLQARNRIANKIKFIDNPELSEIEDKRIMSLITENEYQTYCMEHSITPTSLFKDNFTFAEKTMIKKDWCALLPNMGYRIKRMILARVVGPLYIVISLRTKTLLGAQYEIKQSAHNLAYMKDFIVAGLSLEPHPGMIEFHRHQELHPQSVAHLKEHAPLVQGYVSLQDIFTAYSKRNALGHSEAGVPAVIAAWAGEPQKAKEYLDWGYQFIEKDQESVTQQYEFTMKRKKHSFTNVRSYIDQYDILKRKLSHKLLFRDLWLQYHRDMLDNPEILREIARQQAIKFQLEFAPYQDIVDVPYQEGSLIKDQLLKNHKKKY